uniref:CUB domain-containing protein n=1 Tax=Strongyloides papillosus TaxID=174720 RepID=A0A0N5BNW9_STREA
MILKYLLRYFFILLVITYFVSCNKQNLETSDCPSLLKFDDDGLHGALFSPNYPSNYSDGDECEFLIKVPENYTIELVVYEFKTESCCDTLYIYNGAGDTLLKVLQGDVAPGTIINSNNQSEVFLRFMSDLTNTYKGFYIEYRGIPVDKIENPTTINPFDKNECPSTTLKESVAGISSPNWPSFYPLDITCEYLLEANSTASYIYLEFITFSTESCCDYVEIYDNNNGDDSSKFMTQVKGTNIVQTVFTSTGPYMFIRFYSDLTNNDKGFNAIFYSVPFPTFYIHKPFEKRNITKI